MDDLLFTYLFLNKCIDWHMSTYTLHSRCMYLKAHAACKIPKSTMHIGLEVSKRIRVKQTVDGQSVLNVRMFRFLKGHDQIVHMHTRPSAIIIDFLIFVRVKTAVGHELIHYLLHINALFLYPYNQCFIYNI